MAIWPLLQKCLTASLSLTLTNNQVIILWGLVALAPGEFFKKGHHASRIRDDARITHEFGDR
jgi:hypothetical protein